MEKGSLNIYKERSFNISVFIVVKSLMGEIFRHFNNLKNSTHFFVAYPQGKTKVVFLTVRINLNNIDKE